MRLWRLGDEDTVQSNASQVLQGHAGGVLSVAWAHGGRSLASGSQDWSVRVLRVRDNSTVEASTAQVLRGHSWMVLSVAWAPGGRALASGSRDGTVQVWRAWARTTQWTAAPHRSCGATLAP